MHKVVKNKNYLFPMPVLMIGTYDENGKPNLMNAAWGTMEDSDVILIELTKEHMTSKNIIRNKEFTVAFADKDHVKEADYVGIVSQNDVSDKIEKSHLHYEKADGINAPLFSDFPISLNCKLERIDETNNDFVVYGKIVSISVDDKCLNSDGKLDLSLCNLITYNSIDHSYRVLGEKVADAFKVGLELK